MAIFRGDGGAGDSNTDATITAVTEQASIATTKASDAAASAVSASDSATTATTKAAEASTSATNAANSATGAAQDATAAANSATASATSATAASTAETNAETAETNAETAESNASTSAATATTKASEAATSASSASTSASTATTKASEASTSASNASTSESNAATSASGASTSATNASNSATAAASSASGASTSATNASNSASAASTSETNAGNSATAAATSETNASNSATASAASASTATTKASEAVTSASNAATSASTATTKAGEAATSATNSSNSATSAGTAQTAAEAARDAALAAFDSFDDRYLGQKSVDPTVDNDGNALVAGTLYFNTTDDIMKVYEGSSWVAAYASLSGALLATNNLSDLNNAGTARTNLGLGTAATTAATAYATAAQGTKVDGIEAGADVTDTTNVTAAGALMDSELTSIASVKALNQGVATGDSPAFAGLTVDGDAEISSNSPTLYLMESDTTDTNWRARVVSGDLYLGRANDAKANAGYSALFDNNGDISFYEDTGSTAKFFWDASAESLTLSGTGGLDVTGTATMDSLTVAGNISSTQGGTAAAPKLTLSGSTTTGLFTPATDSLGVSTAGSERMRIDASGNVGVGTSSPWETVSIPFNEKLSFGSSAYPFSISRSSAGQLVTTFEDGYNASNARIDFKMRGGAVTPLSLVGSGNVGIGTSSPSDTLSVVNLGSSGTGVQISSGTSSGDLRFKARTESYNGIVSVYDSGGNEDVRISAHSGIDTYFNSGSNVGIGTSSPASKLEVNGGGTATTGGTLIVRQDGDANSDGIALTSSNGTSHRIWKDSGGKLNIGPPSLSSALVQDLSGRVGIGTTSPTKDLHVVGQTLAQSAQSYGGDVSKIELTGGSYGVGLRVYSASTTGTTASFSTVSTSGNAKFYNGGVTSIFASFNQYNSSAAGHIRMTNNVLQYQVLSDARAKENIVDAGDAGSKIDAIQVRQFDWIEGGLHEEFGFIAQELAPIVPLAVGGEPDDEEMMGVDASKLVPLMLKEIQSLRARVAALEE